MSGLTSPLLKCFSLCLLQRSEASRWKISIVLICFLEINIKMWFTCFKKREHYDVSPLPKARKCGAVMKNAHTTRISKVIATFRSFQDVKIKFWLKNNCSPKNSIDEKLERKTWKKTKKYRKYTNKKNCGKAWK